MSDLIKQTRSREPFKRDFDSDVLADYAVIFGDMNYRLDTGFKEFVEQVHTAPERVTELD